MTPLVSMREALSSPAYFGTYLAGPTWTNWRAVLLAIMGEKLDDAELAIFRTLIGDIMNHSKLGNADYMSLKSFQGGHITPDAVAALVKYHLASTGEGGDAFQDQKGNWHLKANSNFARGMESNMFDWSGGVLEKLKANGYDINNQEFMNGVVNEIGSNKSNSMLMRAVLEPGTRRQIQKEIDLRDKVPDNVAGVLQNSDPVLKLDALHKKLEDFYTALGEGVAGPAIVGLTKLTSGINVLSQADRPPLGGPVWMLVQRRPWRHG